VCPMQPVKCTVMYSTCYVTLCAAWDSASSMLEFGAARQGRFAWEKAVKASINTQLVRIELVISVD
jgi:hypothetical protein